MSSSDFLRKNLNQHSIKNLKSKGMDENIDIAMHILIDALIDKYPQLTFQHFKRMFLKDIVVILSRQFPELASQFSKVLDSSFIQPDGGFLFATNDKGERRLILVAEVKHQGTNDKRKVEGLPKQAQGNAIERLGKNLIGIRAIFKNEGLLPFVCFGNGYDFKEGSSILDRVITMNEFFPLNVIFVNKDHLPFEPVSMFFRYEEWTVEEMVEKMFEISEKSIQYKFI